MQNHGICPPDYLQDPPSVQVSQVFNSQRVESEKKVLVFYRKER